MKIMKKGGMAGLSGPQKEVYRRGLAAYMSSGNRPKYMSAMGSKPISKLRERGSLIFVKLEIRHRKVSSVSGNMSLQVNDCFGQLTVI